MGTTDFDPRARRTDLKLRERARERAVYENRGGMRCPVCDRVFERVVETEERSRQFRPEERVEFCLLRGDPELFVFVHR